MAGVAGLVQALDAFAEAAEAAAAAAVPEPAMLFDNDVWFSNITYELNNDEKALVQDANAAMAALEHDGVCMVCLEQTKVLPREYLHPLDESTGPVYRRAAEGHGHDMKACRECLGRHFQTIVADGYNGVCPRMRCPFCPLVVSEARWGPLVEAKTQTLFRVRAVVLLTIQCSMCHTRCSLMQIGLHPRGSDAFAAALPGNLSRGLKLYEAGIIQPGEFLDRLSSKHSKALSWPANAVGVAEDTVANEAWAVMAEVLKCVHDWERRAVLHCRFLSMHPRAVTPCCSAELCFRCRVAGTHTGQTCEQYQAQVYGAGSEQIISCPHCGVFVVQGDGCSYLTCVCGGCFNFEERQQEMEREEEWARQGLTREQGLAQWQERVAAEEAARDAALEQRRLEVAARIEAARQAGVQVRLQRQEMHRQRQEQARRWREQGSGREAEGLPELDDYFAAINYALMPARWQPPEAAAAVPSLSALLPLRRLVSAP